MNKKIILLAVAVALLFGLVPRTVLADRVVRVPDIVITPPTVVHVTSN